MEKNSYRMSYRNWLYSCAVYYRTHYSDNIAQTI